MEECTSNLELRYLLRKGLKFLLIKDSPRLGETTLALELTEKKNARIHLPDRRSETR